MKKYYTFLLCIFISLGAFSQSLSLSGDLDDYTFYLKNNTEVDFSKEETKNSYLYVKSFNVEYNLTIKDVLVKTILTEKIPSEIASKFVQSELNNQLDVNVNIVPIPDSA